MSYLRAGHPHRFVVGTSRDYVYHDEKGYIEDYGRLTDEGMVEILFERWKTDDLLLKEYLLRKLAQKLEVRLRKKPLTYDEVWEIMSERTKKDPFIKKIIKRQKSKEEKVQ